MQCTLMEKFLLMLQTRKQNKNAYKEDKESIKLNQIKSNQNVFNVSRFKVTMLPESLSIQWTQKHKQNNLLFALSKQANHHPNQRTE